MSINHPYSERLENLMTEKLFRFNNEVRHIEVQIWEENKGMEDKHCLLQARIIGKQPIAVSDQASTHESAIEGAIEKLKTALDQALTVGHAPLAKHTWA